MMKLGCVITIAIAACLFCAFNEKDNIPTPYDVLLLTVLITGLLEVLLALLSLLWAILRFRLVRSLLLSAFIVGVLINIDRQTSLSSFDFDDSSGDELPIATTMESSTFPVSTAIESSPLVLHELDASCDIKLDGLCLEPTFVYTIIDYDEFLIASNNEARNVVEWIMDEAAASTRERLLVWHRNMAVMTSTFKGQPTSPELIKKWEDITTYVNNLTTTPVPMDPFDIYRKVWTTMVAYHLEKRESVMLSLE
jgi:hypothetical protein